METTIVILCGIIVAIFSAIIGKQIGSTNRVKEEICVERRNSCTTLVHEKLDNIINSVDEIKKVVDSKLLGI